MDEVDDPTTQPAPEPGTPAPATLDLTARPALAEVRRWTGALLADADEESADDVLLVVNELVANAYDHTTSPLALRVTTTPDHVRVEVEDGSPDPPRPDLTAGLRQIGTRGRGLLLIRQLTDRWGSAPHPGGKTVWAELPNVPAP
ncbi:ATP-binding protein [Actinosynnema pretiosum]|uniref:ATP-binding protein n=2 Tax=Actinosynnema pretiosum TaxID=42197 RepID=A0A290Z6K1_9PSEU|nr:ATP-binding protein [Actinosynnema pretiosum]AAC13999.1 unknown [Actinosynnema pretiosum subsp. auranticum]ATE54681.1 ATP-binding protein [Actinosynnema pretiosum]